MTNDDKEIRNKESWGGLFTEKNADGSPVQEVIEDGEKVAEISNKESWGGLFTEKNADGTPVKEVTPTKED
jgi:hypothetical protein